MKQFFNNISKYPVSVLYGTLLLILAFYGSILWLFTGAYESAIVDFVMAIVLIVFMLKNICTQESFQAKWWEKICAWIMVVGANLLILLPESNLAGSMLRGFAFVILLLSVILHFSNFKGVLYTLAATLWCCIFIPFHEEFMLMASYPLRLSATMLASWGLKVFGTGVVYSGTSLHLPNLNIAITDACSGINQLDAFLLIAYILVKMIHKKSYLQVIHFVFVIPSIIIANALRIVLTVILFKVFGEVVLEKFWHISLGYVQIIAALLIFVAVGKLFCSNPEKIEEAEK